jgi:transposase
MDIHKNARLTLIRREQLAQAVLVQKMTLQAAARSFHVCARTAAKWTHRYQKEGLAGLHDRSSRPHRSPRRTGEALGKLRKIDERRRCDT